MMQRSNCFRMKTGYRVMVWFLLLTHACAYARYKPNILFILADDQGYGDLGCYGQQKIATPCIDRIASAGMTFTNCYAGSTICAPSRSVLMTGQHTGHTRVRGNMCTVGGTLGDKNGRPVRRMCLTGQDETVGHVMQRAGYRTGIIGKWHLGAYDPNAGPLDRGFDAFTGWRITVDGSSGYYPKRLVVGREIREIAPLSDGSKPYATDLYTDEAIAFIERNKDKPFFLYLAYNNPHSPLEVPDLGPYKDKDWPQHCKIYAAMNHQLDQNVGRLMQTLEDLQLDEKTVVFFCSDNGPRSEPTVIQTEVSEFFNSNGPLRGYKRDLYEGGIRVPMIARWPGRIPAGTRRDVPWSFTDVMATIAQLGGGDPSPQSDGDSMVPVLLGDRQDLGDRFLYWEYFEKGFQQAVRWGRWKALILERGGPMELYNLHQDIGERNNIADQHPEIVKQIEAYLKTARSESVNWPLPEMH